MLFIFHKQTEEEFILRSLKQLDWGECFLAVCVTGCYFVHPQRGMH
jgi:hypothetical protein